ncbi:MAG: hypothetical protein COW84_10630 [Gammaproteobacteria bacterium CG22_combo_CG10-13_8_21_14_all_40_8]|nr:MAG: hypothetical protein COW84_10630 [Gammaproteobacteria bacterium CG22_combo_CG10-13_8_21_14_all_40_8]
MKSFEQALQYHQQGKIQEAQAIYLALIKKHPNHADSWHLAGLTFLQNQSPSLAIKYIEKALIFSPNNTDYLINLSQAQKNADQLQKAFISLQKVTRLSPKHPQAWNNLGNLYQQQEQHIQAINCYKKATQLDANYANSFFNLSLSLNQLGQIDSAINACEKSLRLQANNAQTWSFLAELLVKSGQTGNAKAMLNQALQYFPQNPHLLCAMASIIEDEGFLDHALSLYQKALNQDEENGWALTQILYLKRSIASWSELATLFQQFIQGLQHQRPYLSPFSFLTESGSPLQQKMAGELFCQQWKPVVQPKIIKPKPHNQIRVGYVSADFYQHPTAYLAVNLFESHDRQHFKIYGYSNSRDDQSEIRGRVIKAFDEFVDIRKMSTNEICQRIIEDEIDILVDLKGHTLEAKTEIFARKPAPIQVNYLGYPGTIGQFMDYIIGDKFVTPIEEQANFSEQIVQLKDSYQINDIKRPIPSVLQSRQELGLPENALILGCFNNSWKITPETFRLWMEILKQLPQTVLWLMDRHPKTSFKQNILAHAQNLGIDNARIIFAAKAPLAHYLSYYHQMDLMLETLPYNGHTMASDALWMGCPVLSYSGDTFCSRVGASLLHAVGLSKELHCHSEQAYLQKAIELGTNPQTLQKIRRYLEQNRHQLTLFNSKKTTAEIEQAYRLMMQRLQQQQQPQPIIIQ